MENDNKHNSDIDQLLEKLYSPSEPGRELAKRQLIEQGSDAVAPLIAFLRELAASNSIPRFQTGQEQRGQAAYEAYCVLVQREGYESLTVDSAMKRVFELTINDRLIEDAIFILGEIKSEEAIQFLIKIMKANTTFYDEVPEGAKAFRLDYLVVSEEVKALQAIGLVAVPYLINEIREIDRKVQTSSIEDLDLNFHLSCNPPEDPPGKADVFEEEWKQFLADTELVQRYIRAIQDRILMIFRKIKDPRILPYLEELLKETTDKSLISSIETTIADIKAPPPAPPIYRFRVLASRPRKD